MTREQAVEGWLTSEDDEEVRIATVDSIELDSSRTGVVGGSDGVASSGSDNH